MRCFSGAQLLTPSSCHIRFCAGSFLGTVDVRKGTELEPESSLKLWEWSDVSARYRLGAQVRSL
jgi:hypothetical protein